MQVGRLYLIVPISWALVALQFKLPSTPRHRHGVHGQYMIWLNDSVEDGGMGEGAGRVVRGGWPISSKVMLSS